MAPATGTAILVLVAFVLPGFVALRYGELTYRTKAKDTPFERLLNALYYSFLTYALIFGGLLLLGLDARDVGDFYGGRRSLGSYVGLAASGLVMPVLIAEGARRWARCSWRQKLLDRANVSAVHGTPSGWEHFFQQGNLAFVRVTLKDGRVVGGYFGNRTFAGYTADTPDLYLEQRWELNDKDWFERPADQSLGVYLRAEEIVSAEFYASGVPAAGGLH